jgi:hypothetical protein
MSYDPPRPLTPPPPPAALNQDKDTIREYAKASFDQELEDGRICYKGCAACAYFTLCIRARGTYGAAHTTSALPMHRTWRCVCTGGTGVRRPSKPRRSPSRSVACARRKRSRTAASTPQPPLPPRRRRLHRAAAAAAPRPLACGCGSRRF